MADERKDKLLNAERGPVIPEGSVAPGERKPFHVPELGDLDDIILDDDENDQGQGTPFVILSDLVVGVPKDNQAAPSFAKGQVVRLSQLDGTFGTKKANMNKIRARIKALMSQGNIRLADDEESQQSFVEVVPERETDEVRDERSKRIEAERKLRELQEKHGELPTGSEEEVDTDEEEE